MQVGQTVYLETIGNNARYGKKVITTQVTAVKKKYFHVMIGNSEYRFFIESLCQKTTDWGQTEYLAHLTPEKAEESAFRNQYENKIRNNLHKLNFNVIITLLGIVEANENS